MIRIAVIDLMSRRLTDENTPTQRRLWVATAPRSCSADLVRRARADCAESAGLLKSENP